MQNYADPELGSREAHEREQDRIDAIAEGSFPAGDPPGWTAVVRIGRPARRASEASEADAALASGRRVFSAGAIP